MQLLPVLWKSSVVDPEEKKFILAPIGWYFWFNIENERHIKCVTSSILFS